uniref:Uncharacterized protein n=1 Tax=Anopheles darlingi TaxID=43151 RepID=A0A2M4D263_ANODA
MHYQTRPVFVYLRAVLAAIQFRRVSTLFQVLQQFHSLKHFNTVHFLEMPNDRSFASMLLWAQIALIINFAYFLIVFLQSLYLFLQLFHFWMIRHFIDLCLSNLRSNRFPRPPPLSDYLLNRLCVLYRSFIPQVTVRR